MRKDGKLFWIHLTVCEIVIGGEKHFTAFIRDIQEDKENAEGLAVESAKFRGIFDLSIDPIIVITTKGIITECSRSCAEKFGYEIDELVGQNVSMLVERDHQDHHDEYLSRYLKTGEKHVIGKNREVFAMRKDGSLFPVELAVTEIRIGESHFFVGYTKDLTLKKAQEKQSKVMLQLLQREKDQQDELLLNMLPKSIATRLIKEPGAHIAESFDEVTILFADVVGFTKMSELLPAMTVVSYLNRIFSAWDGLVEELDIEKIKTI